MERDNQQGEAEGVTICDPPSDSNPSGKRARRLELFKICAHRTSFVTLY